MSFKKMLFMTILTIILTTNIFLAYGDDLNPSREELESMIEEVALKRGIPSVIMKAIARTESVFQHYESDGSVKIGSSGSIGLMQIHNARGTFDDSRLRTDIYYNIEAGAEILLEKWEMSASRKIPTVGNMDPNILESWYFPLWAYNGYVESNNPNMIPYYFSTWTKKYCYQDLIHLVLETEYNQELSYIDATYLPAQGLPDKTLNIPYPEEIHKGDVVLFSEGDRVRIKTRSSLNLRQEPDGEIIGKAINGEEYTVIGDPQLKGGYYWQELRDENGNSVGWAARNWMILIEKNEKSNQNDENNQENITIKFQDIENHWAREYIENLFIKGIVKGKSDLEFKPNDEVTKEEFYVMINRIIELENPEKEVNIKDLDQVSDWAFEATYMLYKNDIIGTKDGYLIPKACITRKEVVESLGKVVNVDGDYKPINFEDIGELNEDELEGLLKVYSAGLIKGKDEKTFAPDDLITRAELSKLLSMLYEKDLVYNIQN
jgi:hypothetical protein